MGFRAPVYTGGGEPGDKHPTCQPRALGMPSFACLSAKTLRRPRSTRKWRAERGVERQCSRFGTARRRGPCAATRGLAHESERGPARLDIPRRRAACRSRRRSRLGPPPRRRRAHSPRDQVKAYRSSITRRQRSPIWPSRWVVWSSGTVPGTSSARRPPRSTDRRGQRRCAGFRDHEHTHRDFELTLVFHHHLRSEQLSIAD